MKRKVKTCNTVQVLSLCLSVLCYCNLCLRVIVNGVTNLQWTVVSIEHVGASRPMG